MAPPGTSLQPRPPVSPNGEGQSQFRTTRGHVNWPLRRRSGAEVRRRCRSRPRRSRRRPRASVRRGAGEGVGARRRRREWSASEKRATTGICALAFPCTLHFGQTGIAPWRQTSPPSFRGERRRIADCPPQNGSIIRAYRLRHQVQRGWLHVSLWTPPLALTNGSDLLLAHKSTHGNVRRAQGTNHKFPATRRKRAPDRFRGSTAFSTLPRSTSPEIQAGK